MPSPRSSRLGHAQAHRGGPDEEFRGEFRGRDESSQRLCSVPGKDSGGFKIMNCLGRDARDPVRGPSRQAQDDFRSLETSALMRTEMKTQLLQSNELSMQVKDIHWITEKTLTLLHEMQQEIHQEFLVAKLNSKLSDVQKDRHQLDDSLSPGILFAIKDSVAEGIEASSNAKRFEPKAFDVAASSPSPAQESKVASEMSQLILGAISNSVREAVQPLEEQLRNSCKQRANPLDTQPSPGKFGSRLHSDMDAMMDRLAQTIEKLDTAMASHHSHHKKQDHNREGGHFTASSDSSPSAARIKPLRMSPRGSSYSNESDGEPVQFLNADGKLDIGLRPQRSTGSLTNAQYGQDMAIKGAGGVGAAPPLKDDSSFSAVFDNDTDLGKPFYDPEALYHVTGFAQEIARSSYFSAIQSIMIVLNAIYIGIEADHNRAANLYKAAWPYVIMENMFCLYFTVELIIRVMAFSTLGSAFRDGWIRFDTFLVSLMVCETWVLMPLLLVTSGGEVNIPVGPLRLLRLLKITRMARMMRAFPELILMVKGLLKSLRAISGAMLLVSIMLYTFAIFEHMLLKDEDDLNKSLQEDLQFDFSSLPKCMWTLGACGVFMLDGAANIATYLVFSSEFSVAFAGWTFIVFTLITAMTILQMLIGVLCEVVSSTNKQHEAARVIQIMKQQVMWKLSQFDDGDGKITQKELQIIMDDPDCKSVFRSLNINRLFLMEMQRLMFPTKDAAVAFKPLTEMMLQCRGDNNATVETIASGLSYLAGEVKRSQKSMEKHVEHCCATLLHRFGEDSTTTSVVRENTYD